MKTKKSLLNAFIVIQVLLLGFIFALSSTHNCHDAGCEICAFITCLEYVTRFVYVVFISAYVAINIYESIALGRQNPDFEPFEAENDIEDTHVFFEQKETLVNLKVKLLVAM